MRSIFFWFLLFSISSFSYAQGSGPHPSEDRIRERIHDQVDSVRKAEGISPLASDKVLAEAARDQASYMAFWNKIGHKQWRRDLRTPMNRVRNYGGAHSRVGENVAFVTYSGERGARAIADELVRGWIRSRPHFRNMVEPTFDRTGIALKYDEKEMRIYAVQVFGKYNPPYPDGLEPDPHDGTCSKAKAAYERADIRLRNDRLITDFQAGKDLLRDRYSLYYEYVPLSRFECRNGSTGNEERYVQRLEGRRPMIRQSKKRSTKDLTKVRLLEKDRYLDLFNDPDLFDADLGRAAPSFEDTLYSERLIIVDDGKVCVTAENTIFSSDLVVQKPVLPFGMELPDTPNGISFGYEEEPDTVSLWIPFDRGAVEVPAEKVEPFLERVKESDKVVERVWVKALASIEGNRERNEMISKERAVNVMSRTRSMVDSSAQFEVSTREGWTEFRQALKGTSLERMEGWSQERLRSWVGKNTEKPLVRKILDSCRYAKVDVILVEPKKKEPDTVKGPSYYKELVDRFNSRISMTGEERLRRRASKMKELLDIQASVFHAHQEGRIPLSMVKKMRARELASTMIVINRKVAPALYRQVLYEHLNAPVLDTMDLFQELRELQKLEIAGRYSTRQYYELLYPSDRRELQYHIQACIINEYPEYMIDDAVFWLDPGKGRANGWGALAAMRNLKRFERKAFFYDIPDPVLDSLEAYRHYLSLVVRYPRFSGENPVIGRHCRALRRYFDKEVEISPDRRLEVARFFNLFEQMRLAARMVEPLTEDTLHYEAFRFLTRLRFMTLEDDDELTELFLEAKDRLPDKEWCLLFRNKRTRRVNYEDVLGIPAIRKEFCNACQENDLVKGQ